MTQTLVPLRGLVAATLTPLRDDGSLHLEVIAPMAAIAGGATQYTALPQELHEIGFFEWIEPLAETMSP